MARTLLIVDDNAMNRCLLKGTLSKEYHILEAVDGEDALSVVRKNYPILSAVLLDIQMPRMDGYQVLRAMRESPVLAQIPVIMITGTEDETSRVKALDMGANDYITKPYNPDIIRHCLRNNIALNETSAMINAMQRDKLTGLYNREFFFEKAGELIRSQPPGYYVLLCLDVDNFKLVNDQYGAAEGDRILKHIGQGIQAAADREEGVCGRISGDNFAALFPDRPDVRERVRRDRDETFIPRDACASLSFSCGRCLVNDKAIPASALYDRAYIAKQSVKGRFDVRTADFDDSMLESLVREQQIVGQMGQALKNNEFEPWFQPQYDHATGALIGAEALVRWRHPRNGLIPPGVFIPIFEKNGFIYELDKYIWRETARRLRQWLDEGRNPRPVSVNVSRYDLFRDDLERVLTDILREFSLPADLLRLEITESAFAESTRRIIAVVRRLIQLGFIVEIDDFGSGYSSLNTLKDVPAQVLKLDMRFLEDGGNSDRGGSILESIVRMAKWVGMTVLAEGVETREQADYLKSLGCKYIQGYYYARPMPTSDYEALARTSEKRADDAEFEAAENFDSPAFWTPNSLDTMVFNHFSGGAFIFEEHNGKFETLRVNDEFAKTFRSSLTNDQILRLEPFSVLDEGARDAVLDTVRRARESGRAENCDMFSTRYNRPGEGQYVRLTVRRIAACGDRYLFYGYVDNITSQRAAERRERDTAQQLKAILANIEGGVVVSAVEGGQARVFFCNDRYYALFGYTRDQYEAAFAGTMGPILDEDAPRMAEEIERVMQTRQGGMFDFRARRRDGKIIWVRDRVVRAPFGDYGRPVQLSVLYDVTSQKEGEERLRQSEEELRIALSQSDTTICRYDIPSRTLHVPKETAKRVGVPETVPDMPMGMVRLGKVAPESQDAYVRFFSEIADGEARGSVVYQLLMPGGYRWLEARYTTVFSGAGDPAFAVISYVDVTERLEKEAVYRRWQQSMREKTPESYSMFRCNLNKNTSYDMEKGALLRGAFEGEGQSFNELARRYALSRVFPDDRDAYLAFANSDVMLAAYHRGKRVFALEYREKLGARVKWLRLTVELVEQVNSRDVEAYLLYEDIDGAKQEELLTRRRAQTDSLTGLYNRETFADLFRRALEDGQGERCALLIIDMDGFKQVNDRFGHAAGDETLIELAQKLRATFDGDALIARLGGDEFMICLRGFSDECQVRDRAALACAILHKSFSLDVQLSASVGVAVCPDDGRDFETLYKKADLALYHVKENGKDGYALYTGEMREREALPRPAREESAPAAAAGPPRRRILIVEDNEINRDFLTALFEDEFIVDTAAEGTAALVKLRRYASGISVVLLDLMMPGLDGFAVLKRMRENVAMQNIPVIIVSGMNERETCLEAIRQGASDFITKPVDADLLKLRVDSAISKAENERLRAQNRYLALQNEEAKRLSEAKRHSEELSAALDAAERADLAKSQFLSSMSHEIRTPLNAVIGYNTIAQGEMAQARTDAELRQANMKVMDCLTKSEVASRHLLTIINDVLDMSAIESGKIKVDVSPFDFRSLITSLTVMFFAQARAKGVSFDVIFDRPTEEWFEGDPMRVNQVLTNLLSNAVKFTPEGGQVTLTVTQTHSDDKTAGFRFVVADTGIGMTPEYLSHIWRPFEQAEASISRRFGGTGLGLSITKNLVDLMKGAISVESQSGVGSAFTVDLAFGRMEQPQKHEGYDFAHVNALIADDDPSTCEYIKLLFDRCGARCTACTSGRAAVEAFCAAKERGTPFNVCLIDWRMPGMDGFTTISEIRRAAARELPIVVVTAYDFTEVSDRAEGLGINRFISKPLFQSSLFDLLANISGSAAHAQLDERPRYDFDGARVLLAEDNNMNMEVARRILMSAKIQVDSAWNGQEAVDIFLASRPGAYKAILMDIHMPGMDGYQATRLIRASGHPDAQTVPIIAMTADVFAEDIAQAHSAGMNDHIAKPIDVESLFKILSAHMEVNR